MDVKKCDRCGAVYEHTPLERVNGMRFVKYYRQNGTDMVSNLEGFDLCPKCVEALQMFMYNILLGEPDRQKIENAYNALLQDVPDVDVATGYLGEVLDS